ncbi:MAG: YceI family protein [Arenicella sp.]|nr:YceI family protein [Arenicella sp.]
MKKIILLTLLTSGLLSACVSLITPKVETDVVKLKAGQYSLDSSHATLLFKIQHLGLSTYVGRFNQFDASLEFDPQNIAAARLSAIIEIDSLDINDRDLKDDLMGRAWFRQAEFPQVKFVSRSVRPISDTEFEFSGVLDWRGEQKPISVTVIFHGGASNILTGKYTLGFSAKGAFSRSDFGMGKFVPLVGDEVTIEAYAEFLKN